MKLSDSFFKKIEKKTNVDKDTILSLAKQLQDNDMKSEKALRDVVQSISKITGKKVSKEREDKIINTILEDKVPDDLEKFVD